MSGLVIKLAPKERILINGAVIENGDRRSKIAIKTPNANVLRLKDAIHPDEVRSPVMRVCFIAQLILSGDADAETAGRQLLHGIEQLSQVFDDPDSRRLLAAASDSALSGNTYQALRRLRDLLPREGRMLAAKLQ